MSSLPGSPRLPAIVVSLESASRGAGLQEGGDTAAWDRGRLGAELPRPRPRSASDVTRPTAPAARPTHRRNALSESMLPSLRQERPAMLNAADSDALLLKFADLGSPALARQVHQARNVPGIPDLGSAIGGLAATWGKMGFDQRMSLLPGMLRLIRKLPPEQRRGPLQALSAESESLHELHRHTAQRMIGDAHVPS